LLVWCFEVIFSEHHIVGAFKQTFIQRKHG